VRGGLIVPELPDVAVLGTTLERACDRRIVDCTITTAKILSGTSKKGLRDLLIGKRLHGVVRRGKHVVVGLKGRERHLVFHFGMTGSLVVDEEPGSHARLSCRFEDGGTLHYRSQRMLGKIATCKDPESWWRAHGLGPDALDVDWEMFRDRLRGHRGMIKAALMDQSLIAGLGNVYSDEVCYQARIDPGMRVDRLSDKTLNTLYRNMQRILHLAIKRQARVSDLPDTWLLPHRQEGAADPRGHGGTVVKRSIAGRNAYLVPERQQQV